MLSINEDGPVLRVALNRPEVRNALNEELISALTEAFARQAKGFRAVVLSGNGKAFCGGGDLSWMQRAASYTREQNIEDALKLAKLFQAICDCPAVVVARIHGAAFGGALGLVAASDVAVASSDASFAFSEVKLGLVPATISPFVISKIGPGHARALFVTGEIFSATRAQQIGLVHEVALESELDAVVELKLKAVLSAGPHAISAAKRLALQGILSARESAELLAEVRASAEGREGIAAFLERRSPGYRVER